MCRLAAFPPQFSPDHAQKILERFAKGNGDGTGSVYVKDGEFVVNKWPLSLAQVTGSKYPLLAHMPYPGWTVVHLRAASHGGNTYNNTHPFVKGKWAVSHNGIWSEHDLVKAALKKHVEFSGETDTEVAAQLFSDIGPKKFSKLVKFSGVFLGLNKTGVLWAVKTSGELQTLETTQGVILASNLPESFNALDEPEGWLKFSSSGALMDSYEIKHSFQGMPMFSQDFAGLELADDEELPPQFHAW